MKDLFKKYNQYENEIIEIKMRLKIRNNWYCTLKFIVSQIIKIILTFKKFEH